MCKAFFYRVRLFVGAMLLGLAAINLLYVISANAAAITYTVQDLIVGSDTVTGTITTDGATQLIQSDITDWNLTFNLGNGQINLTGPLSGNNSVDLYTGQALTADATHLYFNYGLTPDDGFLEIGTTSPNEHILLFDVGFQGVGELSLDDSVSTLTDSTLAASGNTIIGTASPASAVPESSTWTMMILGFVGLVCMAYRRRSGVTLAI
jgi:hypothetical protein